MWQENITNALHLEKTRYILKDRLKKFDTVWQSFVRYHVVFIRHLLLCLAQLFNGGECGHVICFRVKILIKRHGTQKTDKKNRVLDPNQQTIILFQHLAW